MGGISTGVARLAAGAGAGGLIALVIGSASTPSEARQYPASAVASLCTAGETPLFSCAIGQKRVAVCGGGGGAVYRFGRPGRVEFSSRSLTLAMRGFAGGGETQITASNEGYAYTVFDRTSRAAFGADGRHDAAMTSGLLVRRGARTLSTRYCDDDATVSPRAEAVIRPGGFVPH